MIEEQALTREELLAYLRQMLEIRAFENNIAELLGKAVLKGASHLYAGQEAVAVGAVAALRDDDLITSTHRGHGHAHAHGDTAAKTHEAKQEHYDKMMAEVLGRSGGYCKGKGGSMHIADFSLGILGANGIVGGGIPIATGAALSALMRRSGQVAAAFFGDGASSQGAFHEAANLAAVWRLPVVYVCENNGYAVSTPGVRQMKPEGVAARAAGYGFPTARVDGNDPVAVYDAVSAAAAMARAGDGPSLVECVTYKWMGHYIGYPAAYRPKEEVASWKARDPIPRFEQYLAEAGVLTAGETAEVHQQVREEIEAAVEFARSSPPPRPEDAWEDFRG